MTIPDPGHAAAAVRQKLQDVARSRPARRRSSNRELPHDQPPRIEPGLRIGVSLRHSAGRTGWLSAALAGMVDSLRRAEHAERVQGMPPVAREKCESHMPKKAPAPIKFDGRCRAVISSVSPEIEGGRFAIKRTVGETVDVEADIFADGHDQLSAVLLYRLDGETSWAEATMAPLGNDRWRGRFQVARTGGLPLHGAGLGGPRSSPGSTTWSRSTRPNRMSRWRLLAGAKWSKPPRVGRSGEGATQLAAWAEVLAKSDPARKVDRLELALSPRLAELMALHPDRHLATTLRPGTARGGGPGTGPIRCVV